MTILMYYYTITDIEYCYCAQVGIVEPPVQVRSNLIVVCQDLEMKWTNIQDNLTCVVVALWLTRLGEQHPGLSPCGSLPVEWGSQ